MNYHGHFDTAGIPGFVWWVVAILMGAILIRWIIWFSSRYTNRDKMSTTDIKKEREEKDGLSKEAKE